VIGMVILLAMVAFVAVSSFYFGYWLRGEHEQDQATETEALKAEWQIQYRQMAETIVDKLYEGTSLNEWSALKGGLEGYPGTGTPVDYDESWGTE
jgi:hypothetical protein